MATNTQVDPDGPEIKQHLAATLAKLQAHLNEAGTCDPAEVTVLALCRMPNQDGSHTAGIGVFGSAANVVGLAEHMLEAIGKMLILDAKNSGQEIGRHDPVELACKAVLLRRKIDGLVKLAMAPVGGSA